MKARPRVVLVGAGHAHLDTVSRAREFMDREIDLVLVTPGPFWYSGLATGVLSGHYPAEMDRLDLGASVEAVGGRVVRARVERIDPDRRHVHLDTGESIAYDVLSLNVGSRVRSAGISGMAEHAVPVKPVEGLIDLGRRLAAPSSPEELAANRRIVVIGGGASGCEIAANLAALGRSRGLDLALTLVTRSELIPGSPRGARRYLRRRLGRLGVDLIERVPVREVSSSEVRLDDGRVLSSDIVLNATGLQAPTLLADSGLSVDAFGAMRVDTKLRALGHPEIFGAGDGVALEGHELSKVGVYAIRQSPILHENLIAAATGGSLRDFRPQSRFLLILNLGEGRGLALRGRLWFGGRLAFRLKDRIDRKFLRRYRVGQPSSSRS